MINKFSAYLITLLILTTSCLHAGFLDDVGNIVDAVADELGPKFNNIYLTDKVENEKPVGNKRTFSSDTPKIYLFIGVENIDPDSPVTASYYYLQDGNWKNVGNFSTKIPYNMNIAFFYVDKPEKMMWPLGNYKIDIKYQNQIYKTINFNVTDNKNKGSSTSNNTSSRQLKFTDSNLGVEVSYPSTMNISREGNIIKLIDANTKDTVMIKQLRNEASTAIKTTSSSQTTKSSEEDDFSF